MVNTTIQVSEELKKKISSFGTKEETYEQILERIYDFAVQIQLKEFLMSSHDTVPVKEALKRAKAKYGNNNH